MPDLSTSDLVPMARDLLGETTWETTSTTTGTGPTVAVPDGTLWEFGAIGEWQTGTVGFEQFFVKSVTANNLDTIRGYGGTTAETHTSGDRVVKDPVYKGRQVQQALNQAILGCWPYVWKTGTISRTPSTSAPWYDLNILTLGIASVMQPYGASSEQIGIFKDGYFGGRTYVVRRNLPTTLVASGNGMFFPNGFFHATNAAIVTDIRAITGTTDIKDSSNLPEAEALAYGAVARLLQAAEIRRVSYGENADVSATVGTGARLQTGAWWDSEYRKRLQLIGIRLEEQFSPDRIWR